MHFVERSHSFSSATNQAPPTVTVVERVHSFSKLPEEASQPTEPVAAQTPWAAVFTPQEWFRATKDMAQAPQSPTVVSVPVEVAGKDY